MAQPTIAPVLNFGPGFAAGAGVVAVAVGTGDVEGEGEVEGMKGSHFLGISTRDLLTLLQWYTRESRNSAIV